MKSLITFAVLAASVVATPYKQDVYIAKIDRERLPGPISNDVHPPIGKLPPKIDLSKYTIGQILNYTLHHPEKEQSRKPNWWPFPAPVKRHSPPLHRLAWLVNQTDEEFKEALFDESAELTLLAPDDRALTPPRKRHGPGHRKCHRHNDARAEVDDITSGNPLRASELYEGRPTYSSSSESSEDEGEKKPNDDDDDEKKEKRRKFFRKLVSIVLRYHLLPEAAYTGRDLADKATVGTALPFSRTEGDEHFRVRVRPIVFPSPRLYFNVYAAGRAEIIAKNGIIHVLSAPLLPPLDPLGEAFLFPGLFSTLTTGIQKVELDSVLAPWLHGHRNDSEDDDDKVDVEVMDVLKELVEERVAKEGKREFTVFAPTNFAFKRLGLKLNAFGFSPFGRRILKKVLAYHVVPDGVYYTDYGHNATSESVIFNANDENAEDFDLPAEDLSPLRIEERLNHFGDAKVYHQTFDTLLPGKQIRGKVVEYRTFGKGPLRRDAYLEAGHGQKVKVFLPDLPAWGGVIHVINSVLRPPYEHKERDLFEL